MPRSSLAPALGLLLLGGCVGAIDGRNAEPAPPASDPAAPPSGAPTDPPPGQPPPPPASNAVGRLRLLTRGQLESSLRDLLGEIEVGPTEPDTLADGFASIGASYSSISPRGLEQVEAAVMGALTPIFADPARRAGLLGCTPSGANDQINACVRGFVTRFGLRAWRRPLSAVEVDRLSKLALDAAAGLGDANAALLHTTSAILTSPHFLYRVEIGAPDAAGKFRYTGWEMASRLSYFLWNSTPDAALLAAAEAGKLTTASGIRAEVARLLASPRARAGFAAGFGRELFGLDLLAQAPKNDPRMTPSLREAMGADLRRRLESRLEPGADLLELIDGTGTFVNAELAAIYGIPGITGPELRPAPLPATSTRAGVLGSAAFLTLHSKQDATSPTGRGKFVREALLCVTVPDPPDNLDTTLVEPPPGQKLTLREHMELHRSNPTCAACHALIDPLGYALEGFDWVGAARDRDNGKPIDTTGSFDGAAFSNARELAALLRKSPKTQDCLVRNLYRYAHGHRGTDADNAEIDAWTRAFTANRGELVAFLAEVTTSDAFRTVSPAP